MSYEDDGQELFIAEKIALTLQEKLYAEHGSSSICWGHDSPCDKSGIWRRRNTQYIDEEDNWVFMCDECFEAECAYWAERWEDYYTSRI